jgi:hypothetical protein
MPLLGALALLIGWFEGFEYYWHLPVSWVVIFAGVLPMFWALAQIQDPFTRRFYLDSRTEEFWKASLSIWLFISVALFAIQLVVNSQFYPRF